MTNILIEGPKHMPSFDLTVRDFYQYSTVLPITIRAKLTKDIKPLDITWCDVLLSIRGGDPLSEYLVNNVAKIGKKVVLLLDDDLMEYKSEVPSYDKVCRKSLLSILGKSDCLLTPSRYLGNKYHENYGIRYSIVDTIIANNQLKPIVQNKEGDPIKLLYAAGAKHKPFFESYIKPILNQLYERYGDKVTLTIVGPNIDVDMIRMKIEKVGSMPFDKYRQFMNENHFDIGLSPLFDEEFCRSKYFNKYLEYSVNGICGVYSKVLPYTSVVQDSINGIYANNDPDSWYTNLCRVIDNTELRLNCVKNAQKDLLSNFNLNYISNRVFNELNDVFTFKSVTCNKKICRFMYFRYWLYRIKRRIRRLYNEILNKS